MRARTAFDERGWLPYIGLAPLEPSPGTPPAEGSSSTSSGKATALDPRIDAHARALLTEAIPDEYHAMIEDCTTAVQIWNALKTQFALQTEEDLIRMKTEFYTIVKLPSETIDQYITKFENQLAALRSQLPTELQLHEAEVIMAFNNSL